MADVVEVSADLVIAALRDRVGALVYELAVAEAVAAHWRALAERNQHGHEDAEAGKAGPAA